MSRSRRRAPYFADPDSPVAPYEQLPDGEPLPDTHFGSPTPGTRLPLQQHANIKQPDDNAANVQPINDEDRVDWDYDFEDQVQQQPLETFRDHIEVISLWYDRFQRQLFQLHDLGVHQDVVDYEYDREFYLERRPVPEAFCRHPGRGGTRDGPIERAITKRDVDAALQSLVKYRAVGNITQARARVEATRLHKYLEACAYVVTRLMHGLCTRVNATFSYHHFPHPELPDFIMHFFTDLANLSKPEIPVHECDENWMAQYFLQREWNVLASDMRRRFPRSRPYYRYPTANNPPAPLEIPENQQQDENRSPTPQDRDLPVDEPEQQLEEPHVVTSELAMLEELEPVAPRRRRRSRDCTEEQPKRIQPFRNVRRRTSL